MSEFKGFKVGQVYKVHDKTGSGIQDNYVFVTEDDYVHSEAVGGNGEVWGVLRHWVREEKIELVFDPDETSQDEALKELKKEYSIYDIPGNTPFTGVRDDYTKVYFDVEHKEIIHDEKEKGPLVLCSVDDFDKTLVMMLCLRQKLKDEGHL